MNEDFGPPDLPVAPTQPPVLPERPSRRRRGATVATTVGLLAGGLIGGYAVSKAATATASPSASASPFGATDAGHAHGRGRGGPGMRGEDGQVIASAIGISASQLESELSGGRTIAQVAQAHGVAVDKVIAALVASENKEIDDRVAAGRITQDQAAQMKTQTQQRVTDLVNGVRPAFGDHGMRGPGAPPPGDGA